MPSYRPGHSCELLPGRQHLGTTFMEEEDSFWAPLLWSSWKLETERAQTENPGRG
jgi:hypothetical protein